MSSSNYLKMVEVPAKSCDVVVKPKRRKKKDVKEEIIQKINDEAVVNEVQVEKVKKVNPISSYFKRKAKTKKAKITPVESETVSVKSSKFDIVSVQVVAIFVLVIGIILTNIFIEDSGMNNLLRSVFGVEKSTVSTAEFSSFNPSSPTKTGELTYENGVMTVSGGSVYSPCDGVIESVEQVDGKYDVTVRHSSSFTTVISGLELCYGEVGDTVYSSVALGFSGDSIAVSMFNGSSLLTEYSVTGDEIVWLA